MYLSSTGIANKCHQAQRTVLLLQSSLCGTSLVYVESLQDTISGNTYSKSCLVTLFIVLITELTLTTVVNCF